MSAGALRRAAGQRAYHAGAAAEQAVARDYGVRGYVLAASRWRGRAGEIDLILRCGAEVIFVEVKTARNFDHAANRISERQRARIAAAASEFLAAEPAGQMTEARFDVAIVDASGRVRIIENAFETG